MRVLLIEDERDISSIYTEILTSNGVFVDTALEGDGGYEKVKNQNFDVLVLDLMLPNKDGIAILKDSHKQGYLKDKKVVILSNIDRPDVENLAKDYGVLKYIVKTDINPQELVDIVLSL
jgi:DNA-binding response OmpR family regulator